MLGWGFDEGQGRIPLRQDFLLATDAYENNNQAVIFDRVYDCKCSGLQDPEPFTQFLSVLAPRGKSEGIYIPTQYKENVVIETSENSFDFLQ